MNRLICYECGPVEHVRDADGELACPKCYAEDLTEDYGVLETEVIQLRKALKEISTFSLRCCKHNCCCDEARRIADEALAEGK